jgi:hypothetical protein
MAEAFSYETMVLLEAADRAIAHSRALVEQRRQLMAHAKRARRRQELDFVFRPKRAEPK